VPYEAPVPRPGFTSATSTLRRGPTGGGNACTPGSASPASEPLCLGSACPGPLTSGLPGLFLGLVLSGPVHAGLLLVTEPRRACPPRWRRLPSGRRAVSCSRVGWGRSCTAPGVGTPLWFVFSLLDALEAVACSGPELVGRGGVFRAPDTTLRCGQRVGIWRVQLAPSPDRYCSFVGSQARVLLVCPAVPAAAPEGVLPPGARWLARMPLSVRWCLARPERIRRPASSVLADRVSGLHLRVFGLRQLGHFTETVREHVLLLRTAAHTGVGGLGSCGLEGPHVWPPLSSRPAVASGAAQSRLRPGQEPTVPTEPASRRDRLPGRARGGLRPSGWERGMRGVPGNGELLGFLRKSIRGPGSLFMPPLRACDCVRTGPSSASLLAGSLQRAPAACGLQGAGAAPSRPADTSEGARSGPGARKRTGQSEDRPQDDNMAHRRSREREVAGPQVLRVEEPGKQRGRPRPWKLWEEPFEASKRWRGAGWAKAVLVEGASKRPPASFSGPPPPPPPPAPPPPRIPMVGDPLLSCALRRGPGPPLGWEGAASLRHSRAPTTLCSTGLWPPGLGVSETRRDAFLMGLPLCSLAWCPPVPRGLWFSWLQRMLVCTGAACLRSSSRVLMCISLLQCVKEQGPELGKQLLAGVWRGVVKGGCDCGVWLCDTRPRCDWTSQVSPRAEWGAGEGSPGRQRAAWRCVLSSDAALSLSVRAARCRRRVRGGSFRHRFPCSGLSENEGSSEGVRGVSLLGTGQAGRVPWRGLPACGRWSPPELCPLLWSADGCRLRRGRACGGRRRGQRARAGPWREPAVETEQDGVKRTGQEEHRVGLCAEGRRKESGAALRGVEARKGSLAPLRAQQGPRFPEGCLGRGLSSLPSSAGPAGSTCSQLRPLCAPDPRRTSSPCRGQGRRVDEHRALAVWPWGSDGVLTGVSVPAHVGLGGRVLGVAWPAGVGRKQRGAGWVSAECAGARRRGFLGSPPPGALVSWRPSSGRWGAVLSLTPNVPGARSQAQGPRWCPLRFSLFGQQRAPQGDGVVCGTWPEAASEAACLHRSSAAVGRAPTPPGLPGGPAAALGAAPAAARVPVSGDAAAPAWLRAPGVSSARVCRAGPRLPAEAHARLAGPGCRVLGAPSCGWPLAQWRVLRNRRRVRLWVVALHVCTGISTKCGRFNAPHGPGAAPARDRRGRLLVLCAGGAAAPAAPCSQLEPRILRPLPRTAAGCYRRSSGSFRLREEVRGAWEPLLSFSRVGAVFTCSSGSPAPGGAHGMEGQPICPLTRHVVFLVARLCCCLRQTPTVEGRTVAPLWPLLGTVAAGHHTELLAGALLLLVPLGQPSVTCVCGGKGTALLRASLPLALELPSRTAVCPVVSALSGVWGPKCGRPAPPHKCILRWSGCSPSTRTARLFLGRGLLESPPAQPARQRRPLRSPLSALHPDRWCSCWRAPEGHGRGQYEEGASCERCLLGAWGQQRLLWGANLTQRGEGWADALTRRPQGGAAPALTPSGPGGQDGGSSPRLSPVLLLPPQPPPAVQLLEGELGGGPTERTRWGRRGTDRGAPAWSAPPRQVCGRPARRPGQSAPARRRSSSARLRGCRRQPSAEEETRWGSRLVLRVSGGVFCRRLTPDRAQAARQPPEGSLSPLTGALPHFDAGTVVTSWRTVLLPLRGSACDLRRGHAALSLAVVYRGRLGLGVPDRFPPAPAPAPSQITRAGRGAPDRGFSMPGVGGQGFLAAEPQCGGGGVAGRSVLGPGRGPENAWKCRPSVSQSVFCGTSTYCVLNTVPPIEDDHGNSNSSHVKIFLPKKLLECLPKCSSLPKERHRWNTN
ncbi:LOW QUALITY PROTEIN: Calmodulin-binding transcription activator 1, partial [Galemys pyrenaicus]